ncbi:MAG: tandem-95 repeat protein [Bacteroidetes bacterium]|nr:tandem-95 repeat protein [Bacteroidota bacterium]
MLRSVNFFGVKGLFLLLMISMGHTAMAQSPVAGIDANDTIVCVGNTISFTDVSVPGGAPIVSWNWTFGDGNSSSSQNPSHAYAVGGNYIVTLLVTDGNGNTATATQAIFVLVAQAINNTVRICSPQSSTTIMAIDPAITGVNGTWFTASGAVIASPGNDTTLVSNLVSGTYLIFWVVSDGVCSDADQVTIIVDQPVTVNAGPDQQICSTPGTATMAGSVPAPGTGLWSTTSAAIIANPSNRNTTISGLTTAGTYTFVWSVTNGSCINRDTMNIVVSSPVAANAGADQQICSSPGTATLAATSPAPGSGLWTTTGAAVITNPTSTGATVSGLTTAGTYTFIWTVINGACVTRDTMQIVVTIPVNANAGNNIQVCTATGQGTLNGNNPAPGTGVWTALNGGVITSPNSSTTTVTGLSSAGFYNFVWTITNGPCITRDTMVIIVRAPVIANAGPDQQLCNATTATLTGNSAAPGVGLWTTTGAAIIATPSSASTTVSGLLSGVNTFIYTTTYGACVSRDTVIIRIDSLITANAGPDITICESQSTVTMAANSAAPGSGLWTKLNGGTITTPSSPVTTITGLIPGNHVFIWTITNGSCVSRDTMRITVSVQIPSNAGLDQQICQGATASLSGNNPIPATGLWTTTSSAIINTPASPSTTVGGLTNAGVYVFVWTVTNGACVLRDTARITVDSSIIATAGPDQNLCNVFTATLAGNTAAPGTGVWTTTSTATISNPALATSGVTNLAFGNNQFIWTITNGNCVSRDTITIRVDSIVTANAGPDQNICSSTGTAIMAANTPASGSGLWTTTSTATIANASSPTTGISGMSTAGTYVFVWTITNGTCINRDTIRITVAAAIPANAGPDQQLCNVTTATLAGNAAAPGSGVWTSTSSATITAPANPLSTLTGLSAGVHTFVWTIVNGACTSSDTIRITIDSLIPANAGPDQQICAGSTVTLSANTPSAGSGVWTALSGGSINTPGSASTTVSGLSIAGNYSFVWTVTNGACVSRDTVVITINAVVIANAGSDQQLCNVTIATLNGNNPAPGTGLWSTTSSASITAPSNPATGITGLTAGIYSFVWTITNGSCITSDTVVIIVDTLITSNAGPDQQVCEGSNVVLAANTPSSGSGNWTALNGGTLANAGASNSAVSGLTVAGNYSFVWTITNGSCISSDTVIIQVDLQVVANAGTDQQLCGVTATNLSANAALPGAGSWTTSSTATITNASDENSAVTGLTNGMYDFIWTITNGTCTSDDTVTIYIDSLEIANAGADQQICSGSIVTMSANAPAAGIGLWTDLNGGIIADPTSSFTTISGLTVSGTYSFVWTIINGTCISTDTITITVDSLIPANAGTDQTLCETQTSTNLAAIAPSSGTGTWTTTSGASIDNSNDPNSLVSGLTPGTYDFIWTIVNGLCTSSDTVSVIVSPLPTAANAGSDQTACANSSLTLNGNIPLTGTGTWTSLGAAIVDSPASESSTVSNLITGANDFVWTISNGACSSSDTVSFAIFPLPVADAGIDQFVLSGTNVILGGTLAATGGTGSYTYQWVPGILLNDSTISNPTVTVNVTSVFTLIVMDSLGCSDTSFVTIWVNNPPNAVEDTITTVEDSVFTIEVLLNDSDPDNNIDSSSVTVLQGPFNGTIVVLPGGQIVYTPSPDFYGVDSIFYTVCDSGMPVYCDSAWIYITVTPVNDPPLAVDDFGTTPEDSCIQIAILLNDSDIENMLNGSTLVIVGGPSNGTFTLDTLNGILTYCPDSNFTGIDTLIYAICDSGFPQPILCDTALVIITVTPDNDPPVAVNDSIIACSGDAVIIAVLSNDFDPEGDTLSLSVLTPPVNGGTFITPTHEIIYTSTSGTVGWDSLQYVICDQQTPAGCDTAWVYIYVHPLPQATSVVTDILCAGDSTGAIDVTTISGGNIIYSWSNGSTDEDIDSLPAGEYTLSIMDTNGCVLVLTDTVFGPASPLIAFISSQNVLCYNDTNGFIDLQVSGGTLPYTFSWDNGSTDEDIDSLLAGTYSVVVTDSNGCQVNGSATITAPVLPLSGAITSQDISCGGDSTGTISVAAGGGTPGYTFSWSNGSTSTLLTNLQAGIYTVTISDTNNCQLVLSDTLFDLSTPILVSATVTQPECLNGIQGSIQVVANGGAGPLTYSWNTTDTTASLDSLSSGMYVLTVTDSTGCNLTVQYDLQDSSAVIIAIAGASDFCQGDSAVLSVINYPGFTYQWLQDGNLLTSDTTHQLTVTASGAYEIIVTSACGVYTDGPLNITVNPLPLITAGNDAFITCDSLLTLSAVGGLSYSWTPAAQCVTPDQAITAVSAFVNTAFVVTGTDALGCSATDTVLVTVTCDTLTIPNGFSPNGDNFNDYFVITNLERYPNANLKIFNRWGLLVFEMDRYDNTWNGLSNSDLIRLGEELPDGTYYYVLDLKNDEKPLNGFVVLRR